MIDMDMIEHLIPSSPFASWLVAMVFLAGNIIAVRLMRFTDDDDE
jgi:hypothetical protein